VKAKDVLLDIREYSTDWLYKLRQSLGQGGGDEDLFDSYAGRKMGMWVAGFDRTNMLWLNRLHAKLSKLDPEALKDEPGIQELIDRCLELGLCSENLYNALRQYGNQGNGLPVVLDFQS
jgi:hypothetical protein